MNSGVVAQMMSAYIKKLMVNPAGWSNTNRFWKKYATGKAKKTLAIGTSTHLFL